MPKIAALIFSLAVIVNIAIVAIIVATAIAAVRFVA